MAVPNASAKERQNMEKFKQKSFKGKRHDGFGRLVPPPLPFGPGYGPRQGRPLAGPGFRPPHMGFAGPPGGFNPRLRGPLRPPPPFMQRPLYQRDFPVFSRRGPLLPSPRIRINLIQSRYNGNNNQAPQINSDAMLVEDARELTQPWVTHQIRAEYRRRQHLVQTARRSGRPRDWQEVKASKRRSYMMMRAAQERFLRQQSAESLRAFHFNPEFDSKGVDFTEDLKF